MSSIVSQKMWMTLLVNNAIELQTKPGYGQDTFPD